MKPIRGKINPQNAGECRSECINELQVYKKLVEESRCEALGTILKQLKSQTYMKMQRKDLNRLGGV